MAEARAPFPGRVDGQRVDIVPAPDALICGERVVDWNDVDGVDVVRASPLSLRLTLADGTTVDIDQLGPRGDEFGAVFRESRARVRRASLTQSAEAPVAEFVTRAPDGALTDVTLFPHVLVVEPRSSSSIAHVPLSLLSSVDREGWTFHLRCRGIDDVSLAGWGPRADEFEARLAETRRALGTTTRAAMTAFEPALEGFDLPDGWAVTCEQAGRHGPILEQRWATGARAAQTAFLTSTAGTERLRYGMWTEGGVVAMPFVLAVVGTGDGTRVAVEAVDADDRATFVFATEDVDRLNAALVLSAFRREVLSFPDPELGRWAVAVRMQPHVRWVRERLVARVVHDAAWEPGIASALNAKPDA
jgi:hypothetical protein